MKDQSEYSCPVEGTLDGIGGKWKTLIIWFLRKGTLRFGELERDGIVSRHVYSQMERGMIVIPVLKTLCDWVIAQLGIPMIQE
ncbi:MAG: helix-turn-helix domain-containing protein [Methanospirillum sp.]